MTGYGKNTVNYNDKKISCEIRSLNSKALDLTTRVATLYREKEMEVRSLIGEKLLRGKVECSLWFDRDSGSEPAMLNTALMKEYLSLFREAAKDGIPMPEDIGASLLRMPEVLTRHADETLTEEEWQAAKADNIEKLLASIEPYETGRKQRVKARLLEALAAIPEAQFDQNRLEQEMIFYIEKLDISEEKQRLTNHLNYFRETLSGNFGQGKKLGFIAQEMGREINTTGSKSNQAEMQLIVVGMKDELEQIKEQVLNVL